MTGIRQLLETDKHEDAVARLLSFFEFECCWGNLDCDSSEYLASPSDIFFKCRTKNTSLEVMTAPGDLIQGPDGGLGISAWIKFDVEVEGGSTPEKFFNWLDENGRWHCCCIYPRDLTESDGDNLYLMEWNGKEVDMA